MIGIKLSVLSNALLTATAIAMTVSTAMASEIAPLNDKKIVAAKMLVLSDGYSDLSPAPSVSLIDVFTKGSGSLVGQNSQNIFAIFLDNSALGKSVVIVAKARKPVSVKRNASEIKKRQEKVAKLSKRRKAIKRRASLMLGVYR
jgi:hypothetical protein